MTDPSADEIRAWTAAGKRARAEYRRMTVEIEAQDPSLCITAGCDELRADYIGNVLHCWRHFAAHRKTRACMESGCQGVRWGNRRRCDKHHTARGPAVAKAAARRRAFYERTGR